MTAINKRKKTKVYKQYLHNNKKKFIDSTPLFWIFGLHAVRAALLNPTRQCLRLIVLKKTALKLKSAIAACGIRPEIHPSKAFKAILDSQAVHQGAALKVKRLNWGNALDYCRSSIIGGPLLILDRVSDPHNVGAIMRSADVFGAQAIIAPTRSATPETGVLAKTASGALENIAYLRVQNISQTIIALRRMGYLIIGLDATAKTHLDTLLHSTLAAVNPPPIALVLGAEGAGLRPLTIKSCEILAKIDFANQGGSLNVSNAAAIALYITYKNRKSLPQ